jgi:hypothetical protein
VPAVPVPPAPEYGVAVTVYVPGGREEGAGIYPECRRILPRLS